MAQLKTNCRGRYPGTVEYEFFEKGTTAEQVREKMELDSLEDVFRVISNPAAWVDTEPGVFDRDPEEFEDLDKNVEHEDGLDNFTIPQLRLEAERRMIDLGDLKKKTDMLERLRADPTDS